MIDTIFWNHFSSPYIFFLQNMVNPHSTQAYVVLIIYYRVLHRGVCIIFQVVLSDCKEYRLTYCCQTMY